MEQSFAGDHGSPRGFWPSMDRISDILWPGEPYPIYMEFTELLKEVSKKGKKIIWPFFERENEFSQKPLSQLSWNFVQRQY